MFLIRYLNIVLLTNLRMTCLKMNICTYVLRKGWTIQASVAFQLICKIIMMHIQINLPSVVLGKLLSQYTAKKAIAEYKKKQGLTEDRTLVCITAIEDCVAGLPNGLDEIIRKYYLQKMSLREMSKRFFLGRDAIARRRDKAIAIISDCLAEL